MDHQSGDNGRSDDSRRNWQRRRQRRRRRLQSQFQDSRRHRPDPPPNPDEWQPDPTWKYILKTMWDNPLLLVMVAIMIAIVLYILFPPSWAPDLLGILL